MRNKHLLWEKIRHFLPFLPINEWELVNRMLYGSLLVGGGDKYLHETDLALGA